MIGRKGWLRFSPLFPCGRVKYSFGMRLSCFLPLLNVMDGADGLSHVLSVLFKLLCI